MLLFSAFKDFTSLTETAGLPVRIWCEYNKLSVYPQHKSLCLWPFVCAELGKTSSISKCKCPISIFIFGTMGCCFYNISEIFRLWDWDFFYIVCVNAPFLFYFLIFLGGGMGCCFYACDISEILRLWGVHVVVKGCQSLTQ